MYTELLPISGSRARLLRTGSHRQQGSGPEVSHTQPKSVSGGMTGHLGSAPTLPNHPTSGQRSGICKSSRTSPTMLASKSKPLTLLPLPFALPGGCWSPFLLTFASQKNETRHDKLSMRMNGFGHHGGHGRGDAHLKASSEMALLPRPCRAAHCFKQ